MRMGLGKKIAGGILLFLGVGSIYGLFMNIGIAETYGLTPTTTGALIGNAIFTALLLYFGIKLVRSK